MMTDCVVDFQEYGLNIKDSANANHDTIRSLGKTIVDKFKAHGYCYLKNHGIDEQLLNEYMKVSRNFFDQPEDFKKRFSMGSDYIFGWVNLERETLNKDRSAGDLHEAFNFAPRLSYNNVWPPVDKFDILSKQMQQKGSELAHRFCDALSLGLDLPIDFMRKAHPKVYLHVRTMFYPPIGDDRKVAPDQVRLGEHTDWGTVAFNFQDDVGGLQVQTPEGEFVPVDPIPGTVVVTPSALLQRWTTDAIKGSVHRILLEEEDRKKPKQAVILYMQPDDDVEISCLDGSSKYDPILCKDYYFSRAYGSLKY